MLNEVNAIRIGLIGRVDLEYSMFDGQTVKTRTLYEQLVLRYGEAGVRLVETRDYKKRPFAVARAFWRCIWECEDVIVSLSRGGRSAVFPLLAVASRLRHTKVYHVLVGGALGDDIRQGKMSVRVLNGFCVNWVESKNLVQELTGLGVRNARYLPNFKTLDIVETPFSVTLKEPFKFCTFGRVCKEKGIIESSDLIKNLNASSKYPIAFLDIYGPIDKSFSAELEELLSHNSCIRYCGVVSPNESVDVLRNYHALLFFTRWKGEGMPGAVIDSLSAGTPVLAYKWQFYDEILEDGLTGFSCESDDSDGPMRIVRQLFSNEDAYYRCRESCLDKAVQFSSSVIVPKICQFIESRSDE